MDLIARVIRSDSGVVPSTIYSITCVNGPAAKGDVLTYCIAFDTENDACPPASAALTIYLCHKDPAQQTREGRPELRIYIEPNDVFPAKRGMSEMTENIFVPGKANGTCDLVYRRRLNQWPTRLAAIYFVVEDCDTTLPAGYKGGPLNDTQYAEGAGPKWQLGVDTSDILHRIFPNTWIPLDPVDPSQPSTTVPMEKRPQRHPAWFKYRSEMEAPPIPGLSGKLSGTKWYKMLGGYPKGGFGDPTFTGSPLTRSGRIMETPVTALYLSHLAKTRPTVALHECGSFPHPTLPDVMASPDGIMIDPERTFKSLPGWFQTDLNVEYAKNRAALDAIDFTRGVYECKTMATKDKDGNGPLFKQEHLAQLYAEMICTGTFWAELVRFCAETREMFAYRVYRKPVIARQFEAVISRMREDLTVCEKSFEESVSHPDNKALLSECARFAVYYNEPRTVDSRRIPVPYDEHVFVKVREAMEDANGSLSPTDPNANVVIVPDGPSKAPKKKKTSTAVAAKKRTKKAAAPRTTRKRVLVEEKEEDDDGKGAGKKKLRGEAELLASWEQIQSTNKQIARAITNGDWGPIQVNSVLGVQSARFAQFSKLLSSVMTTASDQEEDEEGPGGSE